MCTGFGTVICCVDLEPRDIVRPKVTVCCLHSDIISHDTFLRIYPCIKKHMTIYSYLVIRKTTNAFQNEFFGPEYSGEVPLAADGVEED